MRIAGSGFYNKKKRSRLIWVAAGMACMAAGCCAAFYMQVSLRVPTEAREAMAMDELAKKVAITFDDDVIIGLSQEISYKEEVSMI